MAVVTKTLKTGGDYQSMVTWESTEATNLVTDGDTHVLDISDDFTTGLNEVVDVGGSSWVSGASNFVTIKTATAADGHQGVVDDGFILESTTASTVTLTISLNYTVVQDIQVQHTTANGSATAILVPATTTNVKLKNLILKARSTNNSSIYGIRALETCEVENCLGLDIGHTTTDAGAAFFAANNKSVVFRNCTCIDGEHYGFYRFGTGGSPEVDNCVSRGCVTDDFGGTPWVNSDKNASGDTTAPGTTVYTGIATTDFADYDGNDFTPTSGSDMAGNGQDLSSFFTDDITGATRGTWDIGAYSVASSSPITSLPGVGSLTSTGQAPTTSATANIWIDPSTGTLTLTGAAPTRVQPWYILNVDGDNSVVDEQTGVLITLDGDPVSASGKRVYIEQGGNFVEQSVTGENTTSVTITVAYGGLLTAGAATLHVLNPV